MEQQDDADAGRAGRQIPARRQADYLSGIQALVRLPMLQRERDRLQNLNTAGFISGYRGSPLGMYDNALWRAKSFLQSQDIAFVPA